MAQYSDVCHCSSYAGVICKIKWTLRGLGSVKETFVDSSVFSAGDKNQTQWFLRLSTDSSELGSADTFAVAPRLKASKKSEVKAKYALCLLSEKGVVQLLYERQFRFKVGEKSLGPVLRKANLVEEGYLTVTEGMLTILCELTLEEGPIDSVDFKNVSEDIRIPFLRKKYTDVTLIVGDKEIKAHKAVIAARSPVFATKFDENISENSFVITDIDYKVMVEVIEFIYSGKVSKLNEMAKELLVVADKYALDDLKDLIIDDLCKQMMPVENSCDIL